MRRKDREIKDREALARIIGACDICHVAMVDDGSPYAVPMSFGYADGAIYLHSAAEGRKIDVLRRHPSVCVVFDTAHALKPADAACSWGMGYDSVIGFGTAEILTDPEARTRGLDAVMAHYGGPAGPYKAGLIDKTAVIRIVFDRLTGKRAPAP